MTIVKIFLGEDQNKEELYDLVECSTKTLGRNIHQVFQEFLDYLHEHVETDEEGYLLSFGTNEFVQWVKENKKGKINIIQTLKPHQKIKKEIIM